MLKTHTWRFTSSSLEIVRDLEHEQATTVRYTWWRKKRCEICRIFFIAKKKINSEHNKVVEASGGKAWWHDGRTRASYTHDNAEGKQFHVASNIHEIFKCVYAWCAWALREWKTIRKIKAKLDTLGCRLTEWEKSLLHNISERHHENGAEADDEIRKHTQHTYN